MGSVNRARATNLKVGGGGEGYKILGQRLLSFFTAAFKLLASQKSGGGHSLPGPPVGPGK